jgi:hypothetical protein
MDRRGCEKYQAMEESFIRLRSETVRKVLSGALSYDEQKKLMKLETDALYDLFVHRTDHECVRPGE